MERGIKIMKNRRKKSNKIVYWIIGILILIIAILLFRGCSSSTTNNYYTTNVPTNTPITNPNPDNSTGIIHFFTNLFNATPIVPIIPITNTTTSVDSCTQTNAFPYVYEPGTATANGIEYDSKCNDVRYLTEYYCDSKNKLTKIIVDCSATEKIACISDAEGRGYCSNPPPAKTSANTCGYSTGTKQWMCSNPPSTTEAECFVTGTSWLLAKGDYTEVSGNCCQDFVKNIYSEGSMATCYFNVTLKCKDSDGDNKATYGYCIDNTGTYEDKCTGRGTMTEYYCRNNVCATKIYSCTSCNSAVCS